MPLACMHGRPCNAAWCRMRPSPYAHLITPASILHSPVRWCIACSCRLSVFPWRLASHIFPHLPTPLTLQVHSVLAYGSGGFIIEKKVTNDATKGWVLGERMRMGGGSRKAVL